MSKVPSRSWDPCREHTQLCLCFLELELLAGRRPRRPASVYGQCEVVAGVMKGSGQGLPGVRSCLEQAASVHGPE